MSEGLDRSLLSSSGLAPTEAEAWLRAAGIRNQPRGMANLASILQARVAADALGKLLDGLRDALPTLSDPDMALNNFDRFFANVRSRLSWAALCERDPSVMPVLLQMFSTSQHLSDQIIRNPSLFDVMRKSKGEPVAAAALVDELATEIASIHDDQRAMALINAFKQRQMARIIYGDITLGQRLAIVTRQISYVADAICEVTLRMVIRQLGERYGIPRNSAGLQSQFVVLALGKLGGLELNYSSDIDLIFLYSDEGETDGGHSISNGEYFARLGRRLIQLLTLSTPQGTAYRVDLRLRPEGSQGPLAIGRTPALRYYENVARTWERQAFIKARPIAGALDFGREFCQTLESSWVYRRYLTRTDIAGIKALKRKIEKQALRDGNDQLNVKVGRGGIRDIEFAIQMLQLSLGQEFPDVRTGNTLEAIARLEQVNGLTMQERSLLEKHYVFLRKIEHRLQIMFDAQTHRIPDDPAEQHKLALRLGFTDRAPATALEQFRHRLADVTEINRRILDHLLHNTVGDDVAVEPERDLVLDPDPDPETIERVLSQYRFRDARMAYRHFAQLGEEKILFLSRRRCRHFLAAIAPQLLAAIATTPDPDATLVTLNKVSDSLGGKGVLWELFSQSPSHLQLYVRMCAACDYLVAILTSNPGMLDELMDSLILERLPSIGSLESALEDLIHGAEDVEPILISFKHAQHLRVGARDLAGKENIRATTATLADVAEVCVRQLALYQYHRLVGKFGIPRRASDGKTCELVILAAGKVGGREPNYHSDVDVIFLFEEEGWTDPNGCGPAAESTTNQHFFSELGQRIVQLATRAGQYGILYPLDARLRPTGRSGPMATSFAELGKYFASGNGQLWERLALCKARPIMGTAAAREAAAQLLRQIISGPEWQPEHADEIHRMRLQMQETAAPHNLKRGPGGTVDVEFAIQLLQLKWARDYPEILVPNVWEALDVLAQTGILQPQVASELSESYELLRSVEARIRLMNTTARHEFPQSESDAERLAYLLCVDRNELRQECERVMQRVRTLYLQILAACRN